VKHLQSESIWKPAVGGASTSTLRVVHQHADRSQPGRGRVENGGGGLVETGFGERPVHRTPQIAAVLSDRLERGLVFQRQARGASRAKPRLHHIHDRLRRRRNLVDRRARQLAAGCAILRQFTRQLVAPAVAIAELFGALTLVLGRLLHQWLEQLPRPLAEVRIGLEHSAIERMGAVIDLRQLSQDHDAS